MKTKMEEMVYYVIEISDGDSKIKGKGIYQYGTRREAIATFHSKLGVAMKSDLYTSDLITVMNSAGGIEAQEKYVAEPKVVEPVVVEQTEETVEEKTTDK